MPILNQFQTALSPILADLDRQNYQIKVFLRSHLGSNSHAENAWDKYYRRERITRITLTEFSNVCFEKHGRYVDRLSDKDYNQLKNMLTTFNQTIKDNTTLIANSKLEGTAERENMQIESYAHEFEKTTEGRYASLKF